MWVIIGEQVVNLERVNIIRPHPRGTELVFDQFAFNVDIPYEEVIDVVLRKRK